jgi:hypothetical protein
MLSTVTISRAVMDGAKLLDGFEPQWFQRIDASRLNIDIPGCDVLSLLFGDFDTGYARVVMSRPPMERGQACDYGFALPRDENIGPRAIRARWALTDAWIDVIDFRRMVASLRN